MAEKKWEKHIVTDFRPGLELPEFRGQPGVPNERANFMIWLGDKAVKGSPYVEAVWLWEAAADPNAGFPAHVHDYDEVLGFIGTDTKNVQDLGGEIEFWIEDEQYMLTKTCMVYVPKGITHCPIKFIKIERPIFHFLMVIGGDYK